MSDSTDFGTFGRFTETPVENMPTEMKAAYDFTRQTARTCSGSAQDLAGQPPPVPDDRAYRRVLSDGLDADEGGD